MKSQPQEHKQTLSVYILTWFTKSTGEEGQL